MRFHISRLFLLVFIFPLSGFFQHQFNLINSAFMQSTDRDHQAAQEHEFLARRGNFKSGRELLLTKRVPFDPDELLRDGWTEKLKPTLDNMPEMHETHYETAPLKGAYLADTLYLPEKVRVKGHTIIVANYVVFEGKNPVIKGNFDIHFFPTRPVAVLGTTLSQALHKKPGRLNVRFRHATILPSFSLIKDLADDKTHVITFDTSGLSPQEERKSPRKSPPKLQTVAWYGFGPGIESQDDCSTGCNKTPPGLAPTGPTGFSPPPAPPGTPDGDPKANDGVCAPAANPDGNNGQFGGVGPPGTDAGPGGPGFTGANAGNIVAMVSDTNFYNFIANGQQGGKGGTGGTGGTGGNGGAGTAGGNGVACGCNTIGTGGNGGKGGDAGIGGKGGKAGTGGMGGMGGTITVSIPFNSPGLTWSNSGGVGGPAGEEGPGGNPGNAGIGAAPGTGASACGQTASNGIFFGPGNSASFGTPGGPGDNGPAGQSGPPATVTRRTTTTSGGGGGGGCDQFLGGGDGPAPLQTCGDTSPIIVDTEGEGFHLTSAASGVLFDIRGDGHPVQIAWTAPGSHNAFLALDRNGDGKVSSGKELFGNFTPQPSSNHPNGFLALKEFDKPENGGNGDNFIDEHDQVYSKLRLWIDENHDGAVQPNELHTLPELGVYAISLDYKESRRRDDFGNQFRYKAKINPSGWRRDQRDEASELGRWTYDVFLTTINK